MSRDAPKLSRRSYLIITATEKAMVVTALPTSQLIAIVKDAVDSAALAHPEWDMGERRKWDEWESDHE